MGYSPWGRKESDTTERLHFHFHFLSAWTHRLPSCSRQQEAESQLLVTLLPGNLRPGDRAEVQVRQQQAMGGLPTRGFFRRLPHKAAWFRGMKTNFA